MNRTTRWVLAGIALQLVAIGLYWFVEDRRRPKTAETLSTRPPTRVDAELPSLSFRRRDGTIVELQSPSRNTILHVWATWCPSCREELPGLLQLPKEHPVDVVAFALDESWDDVDRVLGDLDATNVYLASAEEVERALGVRRLPVTFLLRPSGKVDLRFDGARDWADDAFVHAFLLQARGERSREPSVMSP